MRLKNIISFNFRDVVSRGEDHNIEIFSKEVKIKSKLHT